jgi:hypothetical protein
MKRNLCLGVVLIFAALLAGHASSGPGQALAKEANEAKKPPFVHTVIFTMKKDAPEGAIDSMIHDAHEMLSKIPTVRDLRCGRPSEKEKAKYDVGLLVLFDDAEGLKTYIDHPQHQGFVAKHLKHVEREKLAIYDFVDAKK